MVCIVFLCKEKGGPQQMALEIHEQDQGAGLAAQEAENTEPSREGRAQSGC